MFHSPSSDTIGIHLGTWKSLHGNIVLFSALHTVRNMGIILSDISCRPCTSVPALLAYDCLTTDAFPDNDPCMDLPVLCDRHNTLRRDIAPTSSRGSNNTGNHCRSPSSVYSAYYIYIIAYLSKPQPSVSCYVICSRRIFSSKSPFCKVFHNLNVIASSIVEISP